MQHLEDFSDERHKAWCLHCSKPLATLQSSRDHVPTKSLLLEPHPTNLPQVLVCEACNKGFSVDEEYFVSFLSAVRSGTTDPERQLHPAAKRILAHSEGLRRRIESARSEYKTMGGEHRIIWKPDMARISRVVLKNARGHVMHELSEPIFSEPSSLAVLPLEALSRSEVAEFESAGAQLQGWPEVGSRLMTRLVTGKDFDNGWITVQDGLYRYAVLTEGSSVTVRSVVHDYLASEVMWDDSH